MSYIISFDIEADGPIPTQNSMISFGCATYKENGQFVSSFYRTIHPIEGHCQNENTMKFWESNPDGYKLTQQNQVSPEQFVSDLNDYLKQLDNSFKWIARPSAFDWMWLKCYYEMFKKDDFINIGFSCHCVTSGFVQFVKQNNLNKEQENELWTKLTKDCVADHHPVNDAKYQAALYFGLLRECNYL